ncbi:transport and Golgi organization protein 6 homolog [Genypterus blacodes]|uniref:transport and Golgi organization protein 6 homolog n=1 Tax=Genypterus blacodes TaxID=154954 RepID=UPI003F75D007
MTTVYDGEMTPAIISALSILTKPLGDAAVRSAHSSQKEALLLALETNRALLVEQLQSETSFQEVRRLREEILADAEWFSGDTEDTVWSFVQECLLLLLTLTRHLSVQLELFNTTPAPSSSKLQSPEMAPPLPPDVLSVTQQKTLGTALQFVVCLGLCPYLEPGVGVPLGRRSAFGAMVEGTIHSGATPAMKRHLLTTTNVLLQLTELPSLATQVFMWHLGDVMAALCQLGYQPHRAEASRPEEKDKLSAEERRMYRDTLKSLLGKVYQPVVIKELLILQGTAKQSNPVESGRVSLSSSPSWLRRLCGQLLSERLMQPKGVQAVVKAILNGGTGGEPDWRKCNCIARILVTCPQQSASADNYYKQVCPQIFDLLHCDDKQMAQQFQCVGTMAALSMMQDKLSLAQQYILPPLLAPLQKCANLCDTSNTQEAVEEWDLTRCVEDVLKVWVVGNSPSVTVLKALEEVLAVIFTLFCFTKQNVSFLRAPCQEILLWFLTHTEKSCALSVLRQLSGLEQPKNEVAPDFHFTPGSDGGARLVPRDCRNEDDALYEKLEWEQWRLECLMQLLTEVKDNDLPGDFFLQLLRDLTVLAATAEEEDEQKLDISAMTLLEVEQQILGHTAGQGQKLALLQVLAVMCQSLPYTVLLGKAAQVVDFMVSLLQRACVGLDQASGDSSDSPVESQTLTMGMGLVATLLSGPQLSAEDYTSMSRLLPALDTLSQKHPDVLVQELASNLRTVIATHGACQPVNFTTPTQCARNPETTQSNNKLPFSKKQQMQTQVRDPQKSDHSSPPNPIINAPADAHIRHPELPKKSVLETGRGKTSGNSDPPTRALTDLLLDACDPNVPVRAFALRMLTKMVQCKNPEAVQAQEKVFMIFLENLEHEDSFIYLSAIQGLAVLADSYPERILERLLKDFRCGPSSSAADKDQSLESRLKLGEVLMRASRAMGELAPHHGHSLVGVFLRATTDPEPIIRVSSLSNLGELVQRLEYAFEPLAQEVSSCLTAIIKTEKEAEVRRAAVHVIVLLLRGLRHKTTQVLRDVLLDLYRALKWVVRSDRDEVAVLHAQLALEELDDVMKKLIFPEQKLEKKIVVLP